jgi:hypothetical protein
MLLNVETDYGKNGHWFSRYWIRYSPGRLRELWEAFIKISEQRRKLALITARVLLELIFSIGMGRMEMEGMCPISILNTLPCKNRETLIYNPQLEQWKFFMKVALFNAELIFLMELQLIISYLLEIIRAYKSILWNCNTPLSTQQDFRISRNVNNVASL